MKKYILQRIERLLILRAAIFGRQGVRVVRLLVDTGSTYTILPNEVLYSIGFVVYYVFSPFYIPPLNNLKNLPNLFYFQKNRFIFFPFPLSK